MKSVCSVVVLALAASVSFAQSAAGTTAVATGASASASTANGGLTKVSKASFGNTADGKPVDVYTLSDKTLTVKISNFGAHIVSIEAPDRTGKKADVVLGYNDQAGYNTDDKTYMGSVVGRYGNRIAKGKFSIDGTPYQVDVNETKVGNTLHGGKLGYDRKDLDRLSRVPGGVELTLVSPDGDMGFPGTLTAHVRYTLTGDKLKIAYTASTDKPTVINLTNHSYFNLAGSGHRAWTRSCRFNADRYTPIDAGSIPLGDLPPVAGTPFDFRKPTAIGSRIHDDNAQLKLAKGYDHNFVLTGPATLAHPAVIVSDPSSGRTLTVYTTEPGVQFYTGNFLDGSLTGKAGAPYAQYDGFCLETQHFPDSPNHPAFPSTTLRPWPDLPHHNRLPIHRQVGDSSPRLMPVPGAVDPSSRRAEGSRLRVGFGPLCSKRRRRARCSARPRPMISTGPEPCYAVSPSPRNFGKRELDLRHATQPHDA